MAKHDLNPQNYGSINMSFKDFMGPVFKADGFV